MKPILHRAISTVAKTVMTVSGLVLCLAVSSFDASALTSSYYANSSKLSKGKWVKIKANERGIHEISYADLRAWGFADPSKVNVYGYGATLLSADVFSSSHPDDIHVTYANHEGDKLYFYSTGDVSASLSSETSVDVARNYYSTDVFYLLSDSYPDDAATETVRYTPGQEALDAHYSLTYVKEELQNPTGVGGYFLGRDIPAGGSVELPFEFKNMGSGNTNMATTTFRVSYGALNNYTTTVPVALPAAIPNSQVTGVANPANYAFEQYMKYKLGYTTLTIDGIVPDGVHTFEARHPNGSQRFLAIDDAWLIYPRLNKMGDDSRMEMFFTTAGRYVNFSLECGPGTRVINITSPDEVFDHELYYNAETGKATGTFDRTYGSSTRPACRLLAYDVNREQMPVEYVGVVDNQNLHAMQTPDMVIITLPELLPAAEQLAEAHRVHDKMDVVVVEHSKIFNEYSSATPDAMGYRRFIKMLYDRNRDKLKYVLMYGPSLWDNRGVVTEKKDRLLVYETVDPTMSANETKAFGTDCYFGMLEDNYNPSKILSTRQSIAVGRIPVTDVALGYAVNRKIIKYIETLPSATIYNTALVMSDRGDTNVHLNQAEALMDTLQGRHSAVSVIKAHYMVYPQTGGKAEVLRNVATNALNRGVGLFTYVGHGNEDGFGSVNFWSRSVVQSTSYNHAPLGVLATCTSFGFDRGKDNVGEALLHKEDGGLIGMIGAGRTVYGSYNQVLAMSAVKAYANAVPGTTMGDIWLEARNSLIGTSGYGSESQANTMCFNLAGDPALRVPAPGYRVEVTAVNGTAADKLTTSVSVNPLSQVSIEGRVVDLDGKPVDNFNGRLILEMYDSPFDVETIVTRNDELLDTITLDQDLLVTKVVELKNGKFKADFVAPVPVHEDGINRITFHADASDGRRGAGVLKLFSVVAPTNGVAQAGGSAPAIDALTVASADPAASEVRIKAEGTVGAVGLNTSSGIGAGSTLVVDGSRRIAGVKESIVVDENNNWSLSIAVGDLEQGNHTATLTVADNAGRRTSQSVTFTLTSSHPVALTADATSVRDRVTFDVDHTLGDITASRLVIEDRSGKEVISRTNVSFPCTVDMTESNLPDGHYTAYVQLASSTANGSSPRLTLTLLKK